MSYFYKCTHCTWSGARTLLKRVGIFLVCPKCKHEALPEED